MRMKLIVCLGVIVGACGACGNSASGPAGPTVTPRAASRQTPDRPRAAPLPSPEENRIRAELRRLNQWCAGQDDCDVVERPKAYPNRKAHGETRGFISSARARLRKLGAEVKWNAVKNAFRLISATGAAPPTAPVVRTRADVSRHHGKAVDLLGRYRAIVMPSKRIRGTGHPKEYGCIVLADKTVVFLERYNTPLARRPAAERRANDGKKVRVRGTVHRICPAAGQAPLASCLTAIQEITLTSPP